MGVLFVFIVGAWLFLHLSGFGILVWETGGGIAEKSGACHYLHSTGIFKRAHDFSAAPCPKTTNFNQR
jgi:hypothetical protein